MQYSEYTLSIIRTIAKVIHVKCPANDNKRQCFRINKKYLTIA